MKAMSRVQRREYPLPFRLEDLQTVEHLDLWLARFADRSAHEAAEILRREWDAITAPAVAAFRDAIIPFRPTSLYFEPPSPYYETSQDWCAGWWLRTVRPETDDAWEQELLLHAPPDRTWLVECVADYGLPEQEVIVEFYRHFYNLSTDREFSSAFFGPPFHRFKEGGYYEQIDEDHPDPHGEWADAYYLFCDSAGHKVLMKESGEVGWSVCDERGAVHPAARSFSNFLENCAICFREDGMLDYYNSWLVRFSQ
jgi:hypothetical protein